MPTGFASAGNGTSRASARAAPRMIATSARSAGDAGALHLDHHLLAVAQRGEVHLRDARRRGRPRRRSEAKSASAARPSSAGQDALGRRRTANGGTAIEAVAELLRVAQREEAVARRDHLTELHVRRAEILEGVPPGARPRDRVVRHAANAREEPPGSEALREPRQRPPGDDELHDDEAQQRAHEPGDVPRTRSVKSGAHPRGAHGTATSTAAPDPRRRRRPESCAAAHLPAPAARSSSCAVGRPEGAGGTARGGCRGSRGSPRPARAARRASASRQRPRRSLDLDADHRDLPILRRHADQAAAPHPRGARRRRARTGARRATPAAS